MTEDETFIRAIVDAPGDDLPRLVYADWLDDHNDPRGQYLRAECEAVETGDVARLWQLAVGLDPVWVARVSMPPVGVCIPSSALTERGPGASASEIEEAERRLGIRFPDDYRAFLLNYNGGYIDATLYFDTPDGPRATHECGWRLHPVDRVDRFALRPDDVSPTGVPEHWGIPPLTEPVERWVSRFVVVGHDPDMVGDIFLSVTGADCGHVRILDITVGLEAGVRHASAHPPFAYTYAEFLGQIHGALSPLPRTWTVSNDTEIPF